MDDAWRDTCLRILLAAGVLDVAFLLYCICLNPRETLPLLVPAVCMMPGIIGMMLFYQGLWWAVFGRPAWAESSILEDCEELAVTVLRLGKYVLRPVVRYLDGQPSCGDRWKQLKPLDL